MNDLKKADEYLKNKMFKPALEIYTNAINDDPTNLLAYDGCANCQYALGQFDNAIETTNQALTIEPERAIPHAILAFTYYFGINDTKTGLQEALMAYQLDSNLYESLFCYGTILLFEERVDDAIYFFNQAEKLNPSAINHHINLALAYKKKKNMKAYFEETWLIFKVRPSINNATNVFFVFVSRYSVLLAIFSAVLTVIAIDFKIQFLGIIHVLFLIFSLLRTFQAINERDWKGVCIMFFASSSLILLIVYIFTNN